MFEHLNFLTGIIRAFTEGTLNLETMEVVSILFGVIAVGAPTLILRHIYLETTRPKVRVVLLCCMAAVYVATVLWLANLFCYGAIEPQQIKNAWTAAFLTGTGWTALMALLLYIFRPKRQLSEEDKMKLKDI